jgi:hypothetical protein
MAKYRLVYFIKLVKEILYLFSGALYSEWLFVVTFSYIKGLFTRKSDFAIG